MSDIKRTAISVPRSTPQREGVSSTSISEFTRALERSHASMRGYMLLRHGKVVAEKIWEPYEADDKVWVYSLSKSFTTTAVGIAVSEGLLNVDDLVLSFFPEKSPEEPSDKLRALRVRDLLTMTSGHANNTLMRLFSAPDGDWIKEFFQLPIEFDPGTHFVYNDGASYMLSAVVQAVSGQKLIDYLTPRLFEPLGFGEIKWDVSPQGINTGGWGIVVRLEDLAKLGQMYLDNGTYNGKQILPAKWVSEATAIHADNSITPDAKPDWAQGYGYHLWRCQHGAFRADGAGGQFLVVMPEQDAVLALMSETLGMQEILDITWDSLLPGFENKFASTEQDVDGKDYVLQDNPQGMQHVRFDFQQEAVTVTFTTATGATSLCAGRGEWLAGETNVLLGTACFFPVIAFGSMPKKISAYFIWKDKTTLEINWVYRENPHRDKLICTFAGDKVTVICPPSPLAQWIGRSALELTGTNQ